ncbi:hypothetical protein NLC82_06145, partial [Candidatus Aminicenantes bacterium AC-335-A11]|nr:hypothetical protein [Candidatus Aminicenantes bacterium AC-335-A11]
IFFSKFNSFFDNSYEFSYNVTPLTMRKVKLLWNRIPDQLKRLLIPVILVIGLFIAMRHLFVPSDFGKYGHYRASAVEEVASKEIKYSGHRVCEECHDDIVEIKKNSYHRNVACEVCHGPAAAHTQDPEGNQLLAPTGRGYCPLCHEYLPSRPTGFPQIVSESHNPMRACISCHDPHDPKPPTVPKECEACHADIARAKALSHHVYLSCTQCHETPPEHKVRPREFRPKKPNNREFCGTCHSKDAPSPKEIPRVDMATHGERYMCWQCHYPHLPEVH